MWSMTSTVIAGALTATACVAGYGAYDTLATSAHAVHATEVLSEIVRQVNVQAIENAMDDKGPITSLTCATVECTRLQELPDLRIPHGMTVTWTGSTDTSFTVSVSDGAGHPIETFDSATGQTTEWPTPPAVDGTPTG